MKALDGIKILDLTHMLSGPYATQLLADLGAETVKIEPPKKGEATRKLLSSDPEHSIEGMGAYFLTLGRNKKSVTINLKDEAGLKIFYELVKKADVVVYNFRAGVAERLGLGYGRLREINPKIITCSITGFGEVGPHKDHTSFDLVAQATGGGMTITGYGDTPLRSGIPIGDLGGGLMATIGILSALTSRALKGDGQHIDISMQDAQVSMLNYMATMFSLSGRQPPAIGNEHFVHVPYGSFPTSDGHIILTIITDALWDRLMSLTDIEVLNTPENKEHQGRLKNKETIDRVLGEYLSEKPKSFWIEKLAGGGVPCAPVNDFKDALNDPHILARNMVVEVPHHGGKTVKQPGNPIKMSDHEDSFSAPPLVGQHTEEILESWADISKSEQSELEKGGVI